MVPLPWGGIHDLLTSCEITRREVGGEMKVISFITVVLFLAITQLQAQSFQTPRKVIGVNNFRNVNANGSNVPFKFHPVLEAVGILSMGCTATHIGNGLVISAGHCFDAAKVKYNRSCAGVNIHWGVREGKNATSVSQCKKVLVLEYTKSKDYALFIVDKPPRVALPIRLNTPVPLGTRVTIFSHPFTQPLSWSGICDVRKSFAARDLNSLGTGTLQVPLAMIHHQCDTNPGSSGAAIIDVQTLEVVGIHDGGYASGVSGYNYGTYISSTYIPAALERLRYIQPGR